MVIKSLTTPEQRERLRELAAKYECPSFTAGDPVQFLHAATGGDENRETTSFVAACLSYGSRKQFIPKISGIVEQADGDVHSWVLSGKFGDFLCPDDESSFYRLSSCARMHRMLSLLRDLLAAHGSIGAYLRDSSATTGLAAVQALCAAFGNGAVAPIVPKDATSACKRLCLFLRWMVRDNSPVDTGLWSKWFDKRTLIIPLDVHVLRQAKKLGLIHTQSASMHTAIALTSRLAEAFPDDPLKGDFALYGLGIAAPEGAAMQITDNRYCASSTNH